MSSHPQLLYLSRAGVEQVGLSLAEVEAAVELAFRAKARGDATMPPKMGFHPTPASAFFHPMFGALHVPPVAGLKWVSVGNDNAALGLPSITGLVLLSDLATGVPTAIIEGAWITEVRTAAVSAIGARYLARKDARRIGFIACGVQARSHFAALKRHFPLDEAVAYSRRRETAEAFAAELAAHGIKASVAREPYQAVDGMDIVVTSVPPKPGPHRFLEADWLAPGAFATLVDLGRSWQAEGYARVDRVVTDDRHQAESVAKASALPFGGPFDAELGEILTGAAPARRNAEERIMFLHHGIALADLSLAHAIRERAIARDLGVWLPL
ncbi:MAG: ornithine cyclodeaminase family protein [Alphaproteobacteria bacterium]